MALVYPANLEELISDGAGGIMFSFYSRPNSQTSNWEGHVQLYLPNDLRNPMDINWEQTSLGATVGEFTSNEGLSAITGTLGGLVQQVFERGAEFANAKTVLEVSNRAIANPYIAMTFKSIGFRKFKMEFRFTPHSGTESITIDQIIKKFRRTALPSNLGGFIGYPGEMSISYMGNCSRWLPKFKKSVITNVDVNYTGQGFYAGMANGFPAETIMSLEFTENELVWRKDITDGASY